MKIAVVSTRFPYPLEKGDKLRLYHCLKGLSKDHEIQLFSLCSRMPDDSEIVAITSMGIKVKCYRLSISRRIVSMIYNCFNDLPFQVSFFYNKRIASSIHRDISEWDPEIIFCQLIRAAEYVQTIPAIRILDFMDAFSHIMFLEFKNSESPIKIIFKIESQRLKRYEKKMTGIFDHSIVISDKEKQLLNLGEHVHVVENGVDTNFYHPIANSKKYDLLFVGNMGYRPNIKAVTYTVSKVLPMLQKSGYLLNFLIAGARPVRRVKNLASDRVVVSGWMEDIRTAYSKSKIFVAPIFSGSGLQNKILESMAMGIPCVTSPQVNAAIGATHEKEILIAEQPDGFQNQIVRLLNDKVFYEKISNCAREFVINNYSWAKSIDKLERILAEKPNFGHS